MVSVCIMHRYVHPVKKERGCVYYTLCNNKRKRVLSFMLSFNMYQALQLCMCVRSKFLTLHFPEDTINILLWNSSLPVIHNQKNRTQAKRKQAKGTQKCTLCCFASSLRLCFCSALSHSTFTVPVYIWSTFTLFPVYLYNHTTLTHSSLVLIVFAFYVVC